MNESHAPSPTPPSPAPLRSLADRVVSATLAIAVAHAMAKFMGLAQARVIGHYYGFGTATDAFVLAYEGLIWTFFLIGEESLGPAFLPVFMAAREKDSEEAAWRFTSILATLQYLLLVAVVAAFMFFPEEAIEWFTRFRAGDTGRVDGERAKLAVYFLGSMAPALLGLSVGSLTYMVLNGYKKFFWPAFADAALKAALVAGILIGQWAGWRHDALVAGVLAAGVTKLVVHLFALRGKLGRWRFTLGRSPHLNKFLALVAPLVVGIIFAKVRDYYNYIYIISSLEPGMLSANSWGRKIYNALGWLIPYPLSIAMFPYLCELVDRDDRQALGAFLTRASRMLWLVFLPLTAVIMVLSIPLAQVLFQTGKVSAAQAALAGRINACYTLVLPFYVLEYIFMQAYFSARRTISVTLIGIFFSTLSMAVSYVGVVVYGLRGVQAVMLVALGYTFSRWLKALTLIGVLKAMGLPLFRLGPSVSFFFRAVLLTAACGLGAHATLVGVEQVLPPPAARSEAAPASASAGAVPPRAQARASSPAHAKHVSGLAAALRAAPRLFIPGLASVILFWFGSKLLRFEEFDQMLGFAKEKLKRRRRKP